MCGRRVVEDHGAKADRQLSSMAESEFSSGGRDFAEIIVVRHGETQWNAEYKMQGQMDIELNETGRRQAASTAERLSKETKISSVYSSDLKRALETAEIIAARCGGLKVVTDPDLRERHIGILQGLTYDEATKIHPEHCEALISHRTDLTLPGGGETRGRLYDRCAAALQRIGDKHKGERVVVVTHGATMEMLHKRARPDDSNYGKIPNASISVFHLYDDGKWTIPTWVDNTHLNRTG